MDIENIIIVRMPSHATKPSQRCNEIKHSSQDLKLRDHQISRMTNPNRSQAFFSRDSGIMRPLFKTRERREIGNRSQNENFSILTQFLAKLFHKNSAMGLNIVWKERCHDQNLHSIMPLLLR